MSGSRTLRRSGNNEFGWLFSDNYFDLLPGYDKIIKVLGLHNSGVITAKAFYDDNIASIHY